MPNIVLLGYDLDQPSFRHRMRNLVRPLEVAGWAVRTERFPSGRYGLRTWERRALLRWADVVVLHQIKLSAIEARLFAACSRRRVFDVDDAIYVRKPRRLGEPADESLWRGKKFAATWPAGGADPARPDRQLGLSDERCRRRGTGDHRLDRKSREPDLPRDDSSGPRPAHGAPPRDQAAGDLLTLPDLAGDQHGARRLERGHRGSLARRRSNRGH